MPRQLSAYCLNEIFEYLEEEKFTLRSCLLVNRLCCEIAVTILWRNVWGFQYSVHNKPCRTHVPLSIISTLMACLPKESKDLLHKNGIFIATPTSKPPLFNYASFCKVLSIHGIDQMIEHVLEKQPSITLQTLNYNKYLLSREMLKNFMNQITSLKSLDYYSGFSKKVQNIMFTYLPGAKNCLADLAELNCSSDIYSEFFYQISQICHNIQSVTIEFCELTSNGLTDLISLQNNLKSVTLKCHEDGTGSDDLISSLSKFSLTLTKLTIKEYYTPLSFIAIFSNLQELIISLELELKDSFDDFNQLQFVTFPQLRVLKFLFAFPRVETLIKFLETNGKNLTEFYVGDNDDSLNLALAKFCPNLKTLFTIFINNELETLKIILNSCQYLESIRVWCGDEFLNDKEFLEVLANYAPKNFHHLELYYCFNYTLVPEELEKFFINWKNRLTQKSLSLIIFKDHDEGIDLESLKVNVEIMLIIEKYTKMGLIKKFRTKRYDYDDD